MNTLTKGIIAGLGFIISLSLVIIGQKNVSYTGLAMELIGLAGLLILLYIYNRKYK